MRRSRRSCWTTELCLLAALLFTGCGGDSGDSGSGGTDADGDGVSIAAGDCDDADPTVYFGAVDVCDDGIDQNCNGQDLACADADEDDDGQSVAEGDCDDHQPTAFVGATEVCGDGIDQDCDGTDPDCATLDADQDGYSPADGDCDDADPVRSPGVPETCDDGVDQDCDGRDLPCDEVDEDGDGFSPAQGDCNDGTGRIFPGAADPCADGADQDCDGADSECPSTDLDEDGVSDEVDVCPAMADPSQSDRDLDGVGDACDDCPGVRDPEQADADGDGQGDACDGDADADGDGRTGRDGDCDDADPDVHPGADEACDGVDQDCNGFPDDGCPSDLRAPLVAIAAGPSLLGSQDADPAACARDDRSDENCDEVPQREIRLSAFAIETHEVTNAQYEACVAAGRCSLPYVSENFPISRHFGDPAHADDPVVFVSQIQAETYCTWAGRRLPTEAEWERAARGDAPTTQRRYPWGDTLPDCARTNLDGCVGEPAPAGSHAGDTTADGVLDLGGNVAELVAGWYRPNAYAEGPAQDPPPAARGERDQVPVRGGAYDITPPFATLTYRGFRWLMGQQDRRPQIGFRCATSP